MLVARQPKRNLVIRLFHRRFHRNANTSLNFANILEVRIKPLLVSRPQRPLEEGNLLRHRIEDARTALTTLAALLGICSITEEPLKRHARIDFRGKGRNWRSP